MSNIVAGLAATRMYQLFFFFFNMCFVILPHTIVVYWWFSRILVTTLKVRSASIHSRQKLLPFHNYFRNFKHLKFQISDIMIQTESIV
jgi:hypothetical protein